MENRKLSKAEMLKLVEAQELAYNNRDLEAFCACFHSEVTVLRLVSNEGFSGMERFREGYKGLFSTSPNLHCEIKSRVVLEESVIDEEFITGAAKFPQGLHAVAIYAFRDGLIDRIWFPR